MRTRGTWLAVVLAACVAGCGNGDEAPDDSAPQATGVSDGDAAREAPADKPPPERAAPPNRDPGALEPAPAPKGYPEAFTKDTFAILSGASLQEVERDFDWLFRLVEGRPLAEILPKELLEDELPPDQHKPLALAFDRRIGPYYVLPFVDGYRGTEDPAPELAQGIVPGTLSLRARFQSLLDPEEIPIAQWRPFFASLREARASLRFATDKKDIAVLDFSVRGAPGGPLDAGPLPAEPGPLVALLRAMPRAYPVTIGFDFDLSRLPTLAAPLVPLMAMAGEAMPNLGVYAHMDRGFVFGLDLTERGLEGVTLVRAKDPARVLNAYYEYLKTELSRHAGARLEGPRTREVQGTPVRELIVHLSTRNDKAPRPKRGGYYSFLAKDPAARSGMDDAAAARHDAKVVGARLAVLSRQRVRVRADPGHLFVEAGGGLGLRDELKEEDVRQLVTARGSVRFRRAVRPTEATRGRLLATLKSSKRMSRIRNGDGTWVATAKGVVLPKGWHVKGYVLTRRADELTNRHVDWAWASSARRGLKAATRDVSVRWKPDALQRWQRFAEQEGETYFAALLDGRVVSVSLYLAPFTLETDVLTLKPELARCLAACLNGPPLARNYEADGRRDYAFAHAAEFDQKLKDLFGSNGLRLRYGAVEDTVFVAFGAGPELEERIVARLKAPGRAGPEPIEALLERGGGAVAFAAHVDVQALVAAWKRFFKLVLDIDTDPRVPDFAGAAPLRMLGWHVGPRLRARLEFDKRLADSLLAQRDRNRHEQTRRRASEIRHSIKMWRLGQDDQKAKTRLPTTDELPYTDWDDGWGRAMRVEKGTGKSFTVRSAGPDGRFGTEDDILDER